jgi:3-phosphoshikimate 1-carboxyvinyltransferase
MAGATVKEHSNAIEICHAPLSAFTFDATECPDLFPPLVSLAAACKGTSSIKGAGRLEHKESNRAVALQSEFGKMGITIDVDGDIMRITGGPLNAATIDSHNDHRIAMAAAISAQTANGVVAIDGAECVAKSYPEFFEDLKSISQ